MIGRLGSEGKGGYSAGAGAGVRGPRAGRAAPAAASLSSHRPRGEKEDA